MDIIYRQILEDDGYNWYTLLDTVWRDAYSNIFPQEVFDARDEHREELWANVQAKCRAKAEEYK